MEIERSSGSEGRGDAALVSCPIESYFDFVIRRHVLIRRELYALEENIDVKELRYGHLVDVHSLLNHLGLEEPFPPHYWLDDEVDEEVGQHWRLRAGACMLANYRFIDQAESFARARANTLVLRRLAVPPPRPVFMLCGSELSHAQMRLHIRCGQDSFIACRLTPPSDTEVPAPRRLHWAHSIIARVHRGRRRRMLETLSDSLNSVVHNGFAYKTLAGHDPRSYDSIWEYGNLYVLDPAWELCPDTCDARHVCASFPWAANALVFADGKYAHWTQKANLQHFERYCMKSGNSHRQFVPGGGVEKNFFFGCQNFLKQDGGRYGISPEDDRDTDDIDRFWNDMMPDVLLRRSLPQ